MANRRKAGRRGPAVPLWRSWWTWVRGLRSDEMVALVLVSALASLVLVAVTSSAAQGLAHLGSDPLLSYEEDGHKIYVRPDDGCLVTWRQRRQTDRKVLDYCAWAKPTGVDAWVPATKEFYRLDSGRRHVVELVAFGLLPDDASKVRYTLPGGEVVEADARRHEDLDRPAYWIHLKQVTLPVDLKTVDGEAVFTRFQVFDATGREIPVV